MKAGTEKDLFLYQKCKCENCGRLFLNEVPDEKSYEMLIAGFKASDYVILHRHCEMPDIMKSIGDMTCPYCNV